MAQKKSASRAEKQVTDTKKKTSAKNSTSKSKSAKAAKKAPAPSKKTPKVKTEYENAIPNSTLIAIISFFLFVLFLIMGINPDGALLRIIKAVILGLIGQAGFYFMIPALLYLVFIHTFGRKNPVKLRTFCTLVFVFLCGSIYHLIVQTQVLTP